VNAVSERIPLASLFPWPCPDIVPRATVWSVSG